MAVTLARLARRLNRGPLPSLVLMTDDERLPDPCAAAGRLPKGSLIVVRARDASRRRALARDLAQIARQRGLYVLIAGDPELASLADGLHLPEPRAGELMHWRARRPHWFLTASAHSLRAAARAARLGADAVFLSPVFRTLSHSDARVLGAVRLRLMAGQIDVPLYALGGIDIGTARALSGAKLAGFAAIGALAG